MPTRARSKRKPTRHVGVETQSATAQRKIARAPKLRGQAPTADSDSGRVVFVDELWTVEVSRAVNRRRWSWILSFPSLTCGFLWSDDDHDSLAAALADVRQVLRRLLGSST